MNIMQQDETNSMATSEHNVDRRRFLRTGARAAGAVALGGVAGLLAAGKADADDYVWQIDPDKCVACGNCATYCVLDESAVKAVNCFDMCGYCDICTGYFETNYFDLDTGAENQLCPTGAIVRTFVEARSGQRFYEYTIQKPLCIGCGKCVKGCALMNASLYLQVFHDRCLNCNECAIAVACPSSAYNRVPARQGEIMKKAAAKLLSTRADKMLARAEAGSNERREAERLKQRARRQLRWRREQEKQDAALTRRNAEAVERLTRRTQGE